MPTLDGPMAPPAGSAGTAALAQLMLAFTGTQLPHHVARRLRDRPAAGVTLFRTLNVVDARQLRAMTDAIQALAPARMPFVVAVDHEGGQLIGLGADATPFAGNLALAAASDVGLARRVAAAIGRELRAVGVNLNYAPVCDLATNPANPALGTRCFGDEPQLAARLAAGTVEGLADAGIAAAVKHFPGSGASAGDPHHLLPVIGADRERLEAVELVPFRRGIAAGAQLVMTGHPALPAVTGVQDLPASLAPAVLFDLLRGELGFEGVTISDALDMRALPQGSEGAAGAVAAIGAGQDLLLLGPDPSAASAVESALVEAAASGALSADRLAEAAARVRRFRGGLQPADGEPSVVGCADHRHLAAELAARSITLVRDRDGRLPLRPEPSATVGVVMPRPVDRTPADTSSLVAPALADAVRRHHRRVEERIVAPAPTTAEIAEVVAWAGACDLLVVGTIDASFEPDQAALVSALLDTGVPTVTAALRTPWDLAAYPAAGTHACTYSIHPPSLDALAAALWGVAAFPGSLPVRHHDG